MGRVLEVQKISEKKVIYRLLANRKEIADLRGHIKNVTLFSTSACKSNSEINTRGNHGVTKYFKIPLDVRPKKKHDGNLTYQTLETPSKMFYIYTLGKLKIKPEIIPKPEEEEKE